MGQRRRRSARRSTPQLIEGASGSSYAYAPTAGAVSVSIDDGAPWTRTWWTLGGDTVTEFIPAAKAQLGTWDTRFDDDYAALARRTHRRPCCVGC